MDILDVTSENYWDIPEGERESMRLRCINASGIKDVDTLVLRVKQYIHFNSIENSPVLLSNINRRFGRPATLLGMSPADVVDGLARGGFVKVISAKQTVVVSKAVWDNQEVLFMGKELLEVRDRFLGQAR